MLFLYVVTAMTQALRLAPVYTTSSTSSSSSSTTTSRTTSSLTSTSTVAGAYSIVVNSNDLNGTRLAGMYVDVRVNGNHIESGFTPVTLGNLRPGVQYQVVIYWYGHYYFRHFSDGDLNRYELITLNSTRDTVTLDALYQYVPSNQAATLNIIADLPNGTQIGTTFNNSDYIQHTPGMWLTVGPTGQAPFTGSFTGGSILPFVLLKDQSYTISMTAGYGNYHFSYWKDDGSTDLNRTVLLTTNATYTVIYTYSAG
jgi:hypothetical protein